MNEKLTVLEVYQKVRQEAEHYREKSLQADSHNQKQLELYVNLANAYNLVSAWLEATEEINPTKN